MADSIEPIAENAQQAPHKPWLRMGPTRPLAAQSTPSSSANLLEIEDASSAPLSFFCAFSLDFAKLNLVLLIWALTCRLNLCWNSVNERSEYSLCARVNDSSLALWDSIRAISRTEMKLR
jgi:hypothetical protein